MVDASSFNLQPNFPVGSVAALYAERPYKEALMRAQQQQQLVQGLQGFGTGVDSLVQRRQQMAQALAAAHMYAQTPEGQQLLGTNAVTSTPASPSPVTANQTANYDPNTGTVTPNQSKVTENDLATSMFGMAPKDVFETMQKNRQLGYEPQKIAIEERKAKAEEENNQIQRMIQNMLAVNTIKNQAKERQEADEKAAFEKNKEILHAGSPFNPFNPVTFKQKNAALKAMSDQAILPEVGKTITHPSGVKITRVS